MIQAKPGKARKRGPSYQAAYQAVILVLARIILYALLNARREHLGQIPEPADNPPGDMGAPSPADAQWEPAAGEGEMP